MAFEKATRDTYAGFHLKYLRDETPEGIYYKQALEASSTQPDGGGP